MRSLVLKKLAFIDQSVVLVAEGAGLCGGCRLTGSAHQHRLTGSANQHLIFLYNLHHTSLCQLVQFNIFLQSSLLPPPLALLLVQFNLGLEVRTLLILFKEGHIYITTSESLKRLKTKV